MCVSSYDDCDAVLEEYGVDRKQLNIRVWKEEIIEHAKGKKLLNSRLFVMTFLLCSATSIS